MTSRCPGHMRHWRIVYGITGLRTPVCVRCGSPNPRSLTDEEWENLIEYAHWLNVGTHVREAIKRRLSNAAEDSE